jgi:hypothetical protein
VSSLVPDCGDESGGRGVAIGARSKQTADGEAEGGDTPLSLSSDKRRWRAKRQELGRGEISETTRHRVAVSF